MTIFIIGGVNFKSSPVLRLKRMIGMLCGRWDGKLLPLFLATYEPRESRTTMQNNVSRTTTPRVDWEYDLWLCHDLPRFAAIRDFSNRVRTLTIWAFLISNP
jgi:hypothetical protein